MSAVLPPSLKANPRLGQWVSFNADGTVTVRSGKVELGQGITTAIAQIAAHALGVDISRVRMARLDTSRSPNEASTTGSRSVQDSGAALRQVCAEVRQLFAQVAGVADAVDYWQWLDHVDLNQAATGLPPPLAADSAGLIGQAVPRIDLVPKLTGAAFLHDMELPGMLHARVLRAPSMRAHLLAIDDAALAAVQATPGVQQVVRRGSFLAVVAVREEQAIAALAALAAACTWREAALLPDVDAMPDFLMREAAEVEVLVDTLPAQTATTEGELSARYSRPYLAHGSIGPSCALAWLQDDVLQVWSHSQSLFALRDDMAALLTMSPDKVIAHHADGAGCYGHNGADDAAFDAALLATAMPGSPVRVQWMREDEFASSPTGPAMAVQLRGALDSAGRVSFWQEDVYGNRHVGRPGRLGAGAGVGQSNLLASWYFDENSVPPAPTDLPWQTGGGSHRNAVPYYHFDALRVANHAVLATPIRASALRALGAHMNVFAIESFMDELAQAQGLDPVTFRLNHLTDTRAKAVIEAAVAQAGWLDRDNKNKEKDGIHGTGMAFARYKNSSTYAAVIVQVEMTATVRVTRVVAAVDCGCIINPDGVRNQVEGGIVQSLSWALKEQLRFDHTRITTRAWADYPILTFSEVPPVETVLINHPEAESVGVGEGLTGPTSAALANAVFDAMGVRVRDLPITAERVMAAMEG